MALKSRASATWNGNLFDGSGTASLDSSKLGTFNINWKARTEEQGGTTNPEELIGMAHASCYCMQFSNLLDKNGTPPKQLDVAAEVTFAPGEGGITNSHLTVKAQIDGIEEADFQRLAEEAKKTCPVSAALAGVDITMDASLV